MRNIETNLEFVDVVYKAGWPIGKGNSLKNCDEKSLWVRFPHLLFLLFQTSFDFFFSLMI